MRMKLLAAAAAITCGFAAQAQTTHLPGETPFSLDNTAAILVGFQLPTETTGFLDLFPFFVTGSGTVGGVFLLPGALSPLLPPEAAPLLATPVLFAIVDAGGNTIAADNFDDGVLTVSAAVTPGIYSFVVSGLVAPPLNLYAAAVVGVTTPVPEPETYTLALSGLALVGWLARRRNKV